MIKEPTIPKHPLHDFLLPRLRQSADELGRVDLVLVAQLLNSESGEIDQYKACKVVAKSIMDSMVRFGDAVYLEDEEMWWMDVVMFHSSVIDQLLTCSVELREIIDSRNLATRYSPAVLATAWLLEHRYLEEDMKIESKWDPNYEAKIALNKYLNQAGR